MRRLSARGWLWPPALLLCLLLPASPSHAAGVDGWNGYIVEMVALPDQPAHLYAITRFQDSAKVVPRYAIYQSTDGGRRWRPANMRGLEGALAPPEGYAGELRALAVAHGDPPMLYVNAGSFASSYLYRSIGDGDWERVGEPILLSALAMDWRNPSIFYGFQLSVGICPYGSFVRSRDGGRTWTTLDTNLGRFALPARRIVIDPTMPSRIYAEIYSNCKGMVYASLLRSEDLSQWDEMPLPPPLNTSRGPQFPAGLVLDPMSNTLYVGTGVRPTAYAPAEGLALWRSPNPDTSPSAIKWTEIYRFPTGKWGSEVLPQARGGDGGRVIYIQTMALDTALWQSGDWGQSWRHLQIPTALSPPGTDLACQRYFHQTEHAASGKWLEWMEAHGGTESLGYPRTDVIADPMVGGQTVQYFQRMVLEWHPENPPEYRVQRRLLGDILYPGADPPVDPNDPSVRPAQGDYHYFPLLSEGITRPTGLGHFVADYTATGQPIYFKEYFDSHGGLETFGYPKEEPKLRQGRWTQRFQAAVLEYRREYDIDGFIPGTHVSYRNFRVLPWLLGDEYIAQNHLPYVDPTPPPAKAASPSGPGVAW